MPAGLVFIWQLLRQEPLIAMGFRFRRSARLGPLRFNFSKGGLSSISVGGRGASFNIPVNRSGGPRSTVGLPGTGLSWSVEHTPDRPAVIPAGRAEGLPNSRRLRPGQLDALKQELLALLRQGRNAPSREREQAPQFSPLQHALLARARLRQQTPHVSLLWQMPQAPARGK